MNILASKIREWEVKSISDCLKKNQNIQCCNFPGSPRHSLGHSLSSPPFLTLLDLGNRLGTMWAQTLGGASRDKHQSLEVRDLSCSPMPQESVKPDPLSQSEVVNLS